MDPPIKHASQANAREAAIPVAMIGLSQDDVSGYIKSVADNALQRLGYSPVYQTMNPLAFMESDIKTAVQNATTTYLTGGEERRDYNTRSAKGPL